VDKNVILPPKYMNIQRGKNRREKHTNTISDWLDIDRHKKGTA